MARHWRALQRGDARRCDDGLSLERCGPGQAIDPAFVAQPVAHQRLCPGEGARIGGLGLIGMGIGVGADQHRELDPIAADLAYQVA